MKQLIGNFLKPLGDVLLNILTAVPLPLVRVVFFLLLAAIALWVISLSPQMPKEEEKKRGIKDLRIFAIILLALQSVFYLVF